MKLAVILALLAAVTSAEQKPTPEITATERIALHSVSVEFAQLKQQLEAIETDITKTHPGFHLDPANPLSGQLISNTPPTPPTKK